MLTATPAAAATAGQRYIPDLSAEAVREELTGAALEAAIRLVAIWRLTSSQATALMGEGSDRTWFRMKSGEWKGVLSQDALTRISALIGIYKGLHLLFSEPFADVWVKKPNNEPSFGGASPVDFMIAGGIPAMLETRGYIDALRGGL